VTEEKPGVHYQVSVTGRQAAAFFFLLLLALALAFFFGMRTGAASKKGPGTVATIAAASDLPVPTPSPAAPARPAEETKLGFADGAKGPAAARPEAPAPEARKSEPPPPAATKPPPTPAAAPAAPATVPKAAVKKDGPFFVQVLATQKADVADEMTKKLRADGFAADVTAVPNKPGWFRVRVGPFGDRAKADAAAGKIQKVEKTKHRPIVVP